MPEQRPEGFAIVPNWLVRDGSVPARTKAVYLVLSSHTGRDGTWYMSHQQIAAESGVSVASVKRSLVELRAMGLVAWDQRQVNGGLVENSYRLAIVSEPSAHSERTPRSPGANPPLTVSEQEEEPKEEPKEEPNQLLPRPAAGKPTADAEFDTWWKAYPRKEAKADARKAWPKARKAVPLQVLLDAVTDRRGGLHRETEFMPYPASWLNGRRWEDEPVRKSASELDRSAWSQEWADGTAQASWDAVAGTPVR